MHVGRGTDFKVAHTIVCMGCYIECVELSESGVVEGWNSLSKDVTISFSQEDNGDQIALRADGRVLLYIERKDGLVIPYDHKKFYAERHTQFIPPLPFES